MKRDKEIAPTVIPAKVGIQKPIVIPLKMGIQESYVIPAKAGIQRGSGTGFPLRSGMTKQRSEMTGKLKMRRNEIGVGAAPVCAPEYRLSARADREGTKALPYGICDTDCIERTNIKEKS